MKIRSRFLTKSLAWLAALLSRALLATCKKVIVEGSPETNIYESRLSARYLYCIWHDSLLIPIFAGRPQKTSCLVSRHQDGSYLADAMQVLGMIPVRGSTSRGGAAALKQLITETADLHIAITPDGPRGPRRQLKQGIVYLASKLNRPIVPTAYGCSRGWRFQGSWTDLLIPKPFSTVYLIGAPLFYVPQNATKEQLKQSLAELQTIMDRLNNQVEQMVNNRSAQPITPEDTKPTAA
ncbi:hypothetical protein MNBD_PLANCTO02-2428 [hydrothermal vent metagenome]|uniref:DUF374 domain-containing protein n=1 Tax=hydrothermal vent metagenome TaxID=652676 RepID=A0A3B1DG40_9ZZZZ